MDPHKRIVTPAEAIARARITPRCAPRLRQKVGLLGWARVSLVDRAGRERVITEQPNMLLDNGLDLIGDKDMVWDIVEGTGFFRAVAVGTGSTAPAAGQSALDAEIARTAATFIPFATAYVDQGEKRVNTITYEFGYAEANGNLTEWGITRTTTPGNPVHVRELFRDTGGTPVTIPKTSDEKLRIAYTFETTVSPITNTAASVTVTGLGTLSGYFTMLNGHSTNRGAFSWFEAFRREQFSSSRAQAGAGVWMSDNTPTWGATSNPAASPAPASEFARGTYTGGSYELTLASAKFETGDGNGSGLRSLIGYNGSSDFAQRSTGWAFVWDEADAFQKTSLQVLEFTDLLTYSWDRA